ncbi:MAG: type II toxin-antitoxin system prevent-host-death family antitoxin [Rhodospirillales bacterium]|nr:type II toxin-antitoxin system prevent-host-death family antitoxin [Rhodospirillales bacterium]
MDTKSYTAVRDDLAKTLDKICRDHSPVLLTRRNAQSVVMLSLEDYRAMEETAYLLRSPANAARLAESIAEIEAGRAHRRWPGIRPRRRRKPRR